MVTPLDYHRYPRAGKFKTIPSKALTTPNHLALAYSPGVADACQAIMKDPACVNEVTIRRHLVAVISNGTAVLGLGNIGPLAAKPVMEGKAILFQKFARLHAIDLEIDEEDPQKFIDIVSSLTPSFGGINLEDIKAPECFIIEQELQRRVPIPVFHDDQHGTAITVAACLINALHIVGKNLTDIRCVISGAGAGALACINLLLDLGLNKENVFVGDSQGLIWKGRPLLPSYKEAYAQKTNFRHLEEALKGADVFLGLSSPGVITAEAIATMASRPIIFALANPVPEIHPHEVFAVRSDALVGTGRSDYPNQVNNLLCFPYIFRGALDTGASHINKEMKMACVHALAKIAQEGFSDVLGHYEGCNEEFSQNYFIPKPFDPRLLTNLPIAVAQAAIDSGLTPSFCLNTYQKSLIRQAYESLPALGSALLRVHASPLESLPKIFYELDKEAPSEILSAAQALKRYKLAQPVFIGNVPQLKDLLSPYPLLASSLMLASEDMGTPIHYLGNKAPHKGAILEGYEKEGTSFFFLHGGSLSLSWIQIALKSIRTLGWIPYVISSTPYENISTYPDLPIEIQEGIAYLRLGTGCRDVITPSIGPFLIHDKPTWQPLSPQPSLAEVLERSAFSLLLKEE